MKKIISIIILMICLGVSGESVAQQCADKPTINDFSPKTGFIGSTVTITGANFSSTPGNNQVFFGATQATVVSSSFGTLEVRVPEGSTTALISVKNQCNLTAYSKTHFNGVFCPTPLTSTSYQNVAQELGGIYGAYNMLSQDMDNDGKPEVISARNGGGITIAINNSTPGNISFSRYNNGSTGGAAQSIAAADFDGDGLKDIVTNRAIMRNISTGSGSFGLQYVTNSRNVSSYQVAAGDFNNDGKVDIIGEYGNRIYVAFNTSTGPGNFNFTNRYYVGYVGTRCTGIQVADVDGDGKVDFLASQGGGNRAVSIRNTTANGSFSPTFENPEYWSSGGQFPYRAMIADFDKDGKIDFTSCNYNGATNTAIWRNTSTVGNISFAPVVNIPSPRNNYRIGVGDVDGDGYPDIVTKSLGVNVFSVYRNTSSAQGTVSFAPRFDYSSSSRAEVSGIVIGDLDGDFVPDIATSGISSNTIRFHRNTGGQNDTTAPTVACRNITVPLSPSGTVSITADMIDNGSGDACGIKSLTLSRYDFTCANIGPNQVTLTATDSAGNQSSCTATVNVQPAAIIVAGQSTVCQGGTVEMNANDGDSFQWKKDGVDIAGAVSQNYVATVTGNYTVIVTNAGGCSGESLVTPVVVNENPTVDITPSGTASLCAPNNSAVLTATQSSIYQWMKDGVDIPNATQQSYEATTIGSYSVRVIDLFGCSAVSEPTTINNNSPEIDVTGSGDFGDVFPNQNYVQNFTISNSGSGDLNISNLNISGADASLFTFNDVSTNLTVPAGGSINIDITFNAPDIRTYAALLSFNSNDCDESSFSFPLEAEITCVAADFSSFPEDILSFTDTDSCGTLVNYTAEIVGNPTSDLTYTFEGATTDNGTGSGSGTTFNLGVTIVTLNVSNPCGDVTRSFEITVQDATTPSVLAQDISVDLDTSGNATITAGMIDNGSNDACGIKSITLDNTSFSCENVGANQVVLTVTDNNDNVSSATATVTVNDVTAPTVITQNISVDLDTSGNATITAGMIDNGSNDACGIKSITLDNTSFSCENIGANQVVLTVTDNNDNVSSATATVTVNDVTAPTVITQNISVDLDTSGNATITAGMIDNGSNDACGIKSITLDNTSFSCENIGANQVVLTVTDNNDNVSSATATVTVNDVTAPTVITQVANVTLVNGEASISTFDVDGGTFDNCSFNLSLDNDTFTCNDIGENTVTLTATDDSGNTTSETAIVNVIGDIPTVSINDFSAVQTQKKNTIFLGFGPDSMNLSTVVSGGSGFTYEWSASTGESVSSEASPSVSPVVSTTYNVVVTNSNGCTASTSIYVCVIDARAIDKKGRYKGKVNVCHHTSGKKGTKHVLISISASAVMTHLTKHGVGTNHADTLGDCNATCVGSTSSKGNDDNTSFTTSISDNLNVYPNPSKGMFDIHLTGVSLETSIMLFDINGKLLERKMISAENSEQNIITIGNYKLSSGIYLLKITNQNESISKKLIVTKD